MWIGRVFFVWLSIFNLFVVSIFWATIVDVFDTEQGKRLFGFIAAGATLGAITGSAVTAVLARDVPIPFLLLAAAALLEVAVISMRGLSRISDALSREPGAATQAIGGSPFAGISRVLASPYLLGICLFLLLFSITSTFLYFEQAGIAKRSFPDRGAQTAFFASVDLAVNVLTLGIQLFLTGRIVKRLGVGLTLAILPSSARWASGCSRSRPPSPAWWCSGCCAGPATSPSPGRCARFCSRCCRGRTATRPRPSSTRWSTASATRSAPGPIPSWPGSA